MKNLKLSCYEEQLGTILIIDISGYSRFVQKVDYMAGVTVVSRLLKVLMESDHLGLSVSEIEGDAILFYRYGAPPPAEAIQAQFELMLNAFSQEVSLLSSSVTEASQLSIKMVATYGRLTGYSLGGFQKLYGEALIEAHRLLKNHIDSHTYVLIAEELMTHQEIESCQAAKVFKMCEVYDLGPVCYRYLAYPTNNTTRNKRKAHHATLQL